MAPMPVAFALMTVRILQVNYQKLVLGVDPEDPDDIEARQGGLDGTDRGEAPLHDAGAALDVARDQRAAEALDRGDRVGGRLRRQVMMANGL